MKYEDLNLEPVALDRKCAEAYVGGKPVLDELIAKHLISPRIRRHRLTVFDRLELVAAWAAYRPLAAS